MTQLHMICGLGPSPSQIVATTMQEMQKISQTIGSKRVNVLTELTEIKHSQEFLSASFDEMENKIKDVEMKQNQQSKRILIQKKE